MQFSLKTLFVAVTVLCVLCAILVAPPQGIGLIVLGLSLVFAPPALIAGGVYMRERRQAFCIGAASMSSLVVLSVVPRFAYYGIFRDLVTGNGADVDIIFGKLYVVFLWVIIIISGFIGIGMRNLARRIEEAPPPPRSSASSAVHLTDD